MRLKVWIFLFLAVGASLWQGCIHEYPVAIDSPSHPSGVVPDRVEVALEIHFTGEWENLTHQALVSTKAAREFPQRVIIEVKNEGKILSKEERYLKIEEYNTGKMTHNLKDIYRGKIYEVAVWQDTQDDGGNYAFETEDLSRVRHLRRLTTEPDLSDCSYGYGILDLSNDGIDISENGTEISATPDDAITKRIDLQYPTARFEIIATDINEFISQQQEALMQGDSFTTHVSLFTGAFDRFNLYSSSAWKEDEKIELSGRMRLPFDEYDELKIAEGVIFVNGEGETTAKISVKNSALFNVSQTPEFIFPVKRGYVTQIRGNFLTATVDGIFSIDSVWEGEIEMDI